MADAAGLKPAASKMACGFESHPRYHYFILIYFIIDSDICFILLKSIVSIYILRSGSVPDILIATQESSSIKNFIPSSVLILKTLNFPIYSGLREVIFFLISSYTSG